MTTQKCQCVLFSGLSGPAGSRLSTLHDVTQGLGLSGVEAGFEGPDTGRTNGPLDVYVCVSHFNQILQKYYNTFNIPVMTSKQMFRADLNDIHRWGTRQSFVRTRSINNPVI